jgi:hypothetical protein
MDADTFLDQEFERLVKETGVVLPECDCYCGTPWMPRWFRVALSEKFNRSCKIHDIHYTVFDIDNEDADQVFLDHMYMQAGNSVYWKCVAYMMFLSVRVFQFFLKDFIPYFKD